MEEFIKHFVFYLPFALSFSALYFKTVDLVYDFDWRTVSHVVSRFLYTIFFGYSTFFISTDIVTWFSMISLGTILLFVDEILERALRRVRTRRIVRENVDAILKELLIMETQGGKTPDATK